LYKAVTETESGLPSSAWLAGLAITAAIMVILRRTNRKPTVLWNDPDGILMLVRSWRVEACAARLMASVPLGIDLTRSAWKVLQSMHLAVSDSSGGSLRFFVCRPLGQGPSRVGIIVARTRFRLGSSARRSIALSDRVLQDVRILEGAMKAAYPHMPIEKAGLPDIMMVVQGGVQSIAELE
jgi:hypothetical protein